MESIKNLASKVKTNFKTRVVPAVVSGGFALMAVTVPSFAQTTSSGVDYSSLIETLKTGFTEIVTNCVTVAAAILPIGLGLLGLGKIWDVAKKFFTKSTS